MLDQVIRSPLVMNSGVLQRALATIGATFKTDGAYTRGTGLFETDLGPEARAGLDKIVDHYERLRLAERGEKIDSLNSTPTLYTEAELRATPRLHTRVAPGHDVTTDPFSGELVFLPRAEAARRERVFASALASELAASPDSSPDRLRARETPEGETVYAGRRVPAEALIALRARTDVNPRLVDSLDLLSRLMRESPGAEVSFTHAAPARRAGERARLMTEHVETPVGIQFSPTGGLVLHSLSRERVEREVELLARQGLLAPWQGDAAAARTAIEAYAERQALGEPLAAGLTRPQHQTLQALFGDPALYTRDRTLNALRLQQSRKQPLLQSRPLDRLAQLRALDPDLAPERALHDERQFRPEGDGMASKPKNAARDIFKIQGAQTRVDNVLANCAPDIDHIVVHAAHGGLLPNLYAKKGYRPVARASFDPQLAGPDWPAAFGEPDIVFMVRDLSGITGAPRLLKYPKHANNIPLFESYAEAAAHQATAVAKARTAQQAVNSRFHSEDSEKSQTIE
ncbi:MAG TPA: hypothetical protein VGE76_14460, partial [Opitutaceae bacterium]